MRLRLTLTRERKNTTTCNYTYGTLWCLYCRKSKVLSLLRTFVRKRPNARCATIVVSRSIRAYTDSIHI